MRKYFEEPKIEVANFEAEDVMTASSDDFVPGENESGMT